MTETAQASVENNGGLIYKLDPRILLLHNDYGIDDEVMKQYGGYAYICRNATSENFPAKRTGVTEVISRLINFNCDILYEDVLKIIRTKYRALEFFELLSLGIKYADIQSEFPVVALGSIWYPSGANNPRDFGFAAYLGGKETTRRLDLIDLRKGFDERFRIAVIPI